jgi:peptidoglycan/xylan/chitin deacetylase (PgdA/CDA1 family)/GT2 family glycosyltransferase
MVHVRTAARAVNAPAQAGPRVTVVIPTYQRRDLVVETVRRFADQQDAPPFEVVVVVDGSTDGSAPALRQLETPFPLTVLEQENAGRSAACNRGAEAARSELLLFLDDDMDADPKLLCEHARSHDEGADVVFGDIPLHPDSPAGFLADSVGAWADERGRKLSADPTALDVMDFLTGQTSIARDVFLGVGGFDTMFTRGGSYGGEDFDLGVRLVRAGYRMLFNPRAISRQRYVVSPRQHLFQWRDRGVARVMLARRYPEYAPTLLARKEQATERYVWRWLRRPLAEVVLARVARGYEGNRTVAWYRRGRDLEYFAGVRAAGGVPAPGPVRVLCYHAVRDLPDTGVLAPYGVPPLKFRRQLRLLARHFHFVDAGEFERYLAGAGVPRRAVLMTFDDCYADLLSEALPALEEVHAPALAFAVTGLVGGVNEWDRRHGYEPLQLLDADGLRDLERRGVAVGPHTRTHPRLDRSSAEEQRSEITGAVDDLRTAGFAEVALLAYPYGQFDANAKQAAREAGLRGAFTTRPGVVQPGDDPFELPRIEIVRADGTIRFAFKVLTGRRGRRRRALRPLRRLRATGPDPAQSGSVSGSS